MMTDERTICLARNWVGWVGLRGAAEAMGVTEDVIRDWLETAPATSSSSAEKTAEPVEKIDKRRKYTPEQKTEALRLVEVIGPSKASRQLGISLATLNQWRQKKLLLGSR